MAKSSIDLEEVRENIAYVVPHVSSSGGYQSMIMLLEPDEKGQPRCVECTKSVADVAKNIALITSGVIPPLIWIRSRALKNQPKNLRLQIIWLIG